MARKKNPAAVALGRRSGVSLTPEQRTARASLAASTRWRKAKPPTDAKPGRWYGLVLVPEDPNPPKPGDKDFVGGVLAGAKLLDQALASPEVIFWSQNRVEVKRRQQMEDLRDRWTEIVDFDFDPERAPRVAHRDRQGKTS